MGFSCSPPQISRRYCRGVLSNPPKTHPALPITYDGGKAREVLPLYSNVKPQNVRYRTERLWPGYYDLRVLANEGPLQIKYRQAPI